MSAIAAVLAIVFVTPAGALAGYPLDARIRHAAQFAQERLARTAGSLPSTAYPQTTGRGRRLAHDRPRCLDQRLPF
ncbi:MAG: hypothetical protein AVDCRST_MAG17-2347 [uncultured Solirubrobacterales bacterium]|uniref:Uncharacterized protein n=1 Tax=uncultured Solirubrobacterales bacterium TaxID=768556 RepID=A0A6J4T906_9ACTN|nr:MAG: hypothetical protein AVDCRST_MAG17-2347 [uncultured Solirubrobacterales bacterium]